jgi:predicted N-acetyltransferase YhbS
VSEERVGHDERIRPVRDNDWPGIAAVEAAAYAGSSLTEGLAALESKGRASPDTCFVLDLDGEIEGYLLALPYPRFQYPPLARVDEPAHDSRNLHLHDMVVAHEQRGNGWGRGLLNRLAAAARPRFEHISLVAVDGMAPFWAAHGYRAHPRVRLPESYGENAVYMSIAVSGRDTSPPEEAARFPCPVS